jgi:hypothetical protein
MDIRSKAEPRGDLSIKVKRSPTTWRVHTQWDRPVSLKWKLKNNMNLGYVKSWFANEVVAKISRKYFDLVVMTSQLSVRLFKADGQIYNYGVVCRKSITDEGVAYINDDWTSDGTDITTLKYHGVGTGSTAAAGADTNLSAAISTQARATGTMSQPSAPVMQSVGTLSFDASHAITEHGLFDTNTVSGDDTLWDRHLFSAINVANGDSIEFTYQCTLTSSG